MKTNRWIILSAAIAVLLVVLVAGYLGKASSDTSLEFVVRDVNSGDWVYGTEIRLQDRTIRGFFDTSFQFTGLDRGPGTLTIEAPHYESVEVEVNLRRGRNVLEEPIDMMGLQIPGLSHFIVMERIQEGDLVSELRPVGTNGQAILNHPSMDIRMLVRVSAQILNGAYSYEPSDEGAERGEELYRGELTPVWDPNPGTVFRWTASLPVEEIGTSRALYWVVDYLILVPRPGEIGPDELDEIAAGFDSRTSVAEWLTHLDSLESLESHLFTSWNVVAGG